MAPTAILKPDNLGGECRNDARGGEDGNHLASSASCKFLPPSPSQSESKDGFLASQSEDHLPVGPPAPPTRAGELLPRMLPSRRVRIRRAPCDALVSDDDPCFQHAIAHRGTSWHTGWLTMAYHGEPPQPVSKPYIYHTMHIMLDSCSISKHTTSCSTTRAKSRTPLQAQGELDKASVIKRSADPGSKGSAALPRHPIG